MLVLLLLLLLLLFQCIWCPFSCNQNANDNDVIMFNIFLLIKSSLTGVHSKDLFYKIVFEKSFVMLIRKCRVIDKENIVFFCFNCARLFKPFYLFQKN